ncbi:4Fe-4S ferredoxin [Dictyobacter alpinus]|uniref:4Fe-4S ferredoxin n=1 Tax=Dictyobacter alpinus TaxID=2014873 RepID=A0A402BFY2_9CHLR|nr:4Fe-4S dicluster domain-containing protein [Dictyobacter alpinus]GCE30219.1 4Fe-4S ferredoxin [Dictyobacter alpinus]
MGNNGFFTDTTLCIGCKACEVACKQWNQLPSDGFKMSGYSYDNTVALSATTWRHVDFVEQKHFPDGSGKPVNWLMMSDVCKHCTHAGCMEACPTGAIIRNEFGDVFVQPDICNGCGYCVPSCPFGVIDRNETTGNAAKCTLCYDRQKDGIEPACAKACPTDSIIFGDVDELKERARKRVDTLHDRGVDTAYLYGVDEDTSVGDLNAFFLLTERPSVYNLPEKPRLPQDNVLPGFMACFAAGALLTVTTFFSLWKHV